MATSNAVEQVSVQTRHAQERTLERLKISLGQIQQLIDAGAYAGLSRITADSAKKGILLFSPPDDCHILVWLARSSRTILTVMPFSYQSEHIRHCLGDSVVDGCLRRSRGLATTWLTRFDQPEPHPPEPAAQPAAPKPPAPPKVTILVRMGVYVSRFQVPAELSPEQMQEFGLQGVITQQGIRLKLLQLMENLAFVRLLEARLGVSKMALEDLQAVHMQLSIAGIQRPHVGLDTPHIDCASWDLQANAKACAHPCSMSDVLDSSALSNLLAFSFSPGLAPLEP
jgi:hypothetical protein